MAIKLCYIRSYKDSDKYLMMYSEIPYQFVIKFGLLGIITEHDITKSVTLFEETCDCYAINTLITHNTNYIHLKGFNGLSGDENQPSHPAI